MKLDTGVLPFRLVMRFACKMSLLVARRLQVRFRIRRLVRWQSRSRCNSNASANNKLMIWFLALEALILKAFMPGGMISRFPPDLAMLLDSQVQRHSLQTTILVAGVDGAGAHIFNIEDPGAMSSFDRLGYHAIGSGHRHAVLKMVGMGQHKSMSLNETVFNVYCAKRVAELAPGVGQATSMKIVTADGITPLEQGTLEQMEPAYKAQEKPELAAVKKVIEKLPFGKESPHATE